MPTWKETEEMFPTWGDVDGKPWASLEELATQYRDAERRLKVGIMEVKDDLKDADEQQTVVLMDTLRILNAMLRDVQDARIMCTRYYEPGYYRNPRMSLNLGPADVRVD